MTQDAVKRVTKLHASFLNKEHSVCKISMLFRGHVCTCMHINRCHSVRNGTFFTRFMHMTPI
jgi:hypothetical protein